MNEVQPLPRSIVVAVWRLDVKDVLPNPWIFEAEGFSGLLPVIYKVHRIKITASYHNVLGVTRIGDTMAKPLIPHGR